MENSPISLSDQLRKKMWGWGLTSVLVAGSLVGYGTYAKNTSTTVLAQSVTPMPPMPGMPGMNVTPTAMPVMPGMNMPTGVPGYALPTTGSDLDALAQKMQDMTQSLQGMMWQLDQKSNSLIAPTAIPMTPAVDMQAMMLEMQSINQAMGPLMLRIQSDLQGTPSAEELAAVRAQVVQISTRIANLLTQLQMVRGGVNPGMAASMAAAVPTMAPMQGMGTMNGTAQSDQSQAMMMKLDQMMQQMQGLMQQMQGQQSQSGNMAGQPGAMPGMNMSLPTPTPMPGMNNMPSQSAAMPGMSSSGANMNGMMSMMDDMMMKMDSMMSTMNTSMSGMSTPDPAMSSTMSMMDDMMSMMDSMMMMMDDMMMPMDMMGMPDM